MPARRVSTTRRGALGGALALALLTACEVDDLRPPEDDATPVPSPTPGATETPEPDADARLVEEVVTAIGVATAHVVGARDLPRLRKRLGPVLRMHETHLGALDAETPATDQPVVPTSPADGLRTVTEQEQLLHRTLADAAVRAPRTP